VECLELSGNRSIADVPEWLSELHSLHTLHLYTTSINYIPDPLITFMLSPNLKLLLFGKDNSSFFKLSRSTERGPTVLKLGYMLRGLSTLISKLRTKPPSKIRDELINVIGKALH
jgi:hypothetical protein